MKWQQLDWVGDGIDACHQMDLLNKSKENEVPNIQPNQEKPQDPKKLEEKQK
jgi:hypothetical protein